MRGRILVVDDERPIAEILKFSLEKEGYDVLLAFDGEEAVEKARRDKPDLILLDIMLPKRVKANLRRLQRGARDEKAVWVIGDLMIDPGAYRVTKRGQLIHLTQREFELLAYLAKQRGKVLTREHLLEAVWGYDFYGDARTVDVTVRRLREKIEDCPSQPAYLLTSRGVGYLLTAPGDGGAG